MTAMEDFRGRLVAVETRQADDRQEIRRLRDKVHELVGAVSAISLLTAELGRVREDVAAIRSEIPNVARQAAGEAIDVALERHGEIEAGRRSESRARDSLLLQLGGWLVALVSLALLLRDHL